MVMIEGEDTLFRSCRECSIGDLELCIRSGYDVNSRGILYTFAFNIFCFF